MPTKKKVFFIRVSALLISFSLLILNSCQQKADNGIKKLTTGNGILYVAEEAQDEMMYNDLNMDTDFGHWRVDDSKITAVAVGNGGQHDRQAGGIGAVASFYKKNTKLIDYSVEIQKTKASTDVYGIFFRAKNAQNCIQFTRYGAQLFLMRMRDGTPEMLDQIGGYPAESAETLKIEIVGRHFKGYYNGAIVFEYDFGEEGINEFGNFGLHTNHNNAEFGGLKLDIKKSEKAPNDNSDAQITDVKLSKNEVGRQMLSVHVKGINNNDDILGVTTIAKGVIDNEAFGGFGITSGNNFSDTKVSAEISKDTKTAGLVLRALGENGNDGYIVFGRSYDNIVLCLIKNGINNIIKYYSIPLNTEVTSLLAEIKGNTFTGKINGIRVIKHKFDNNEINSTGEAGITTDIQSTVFKNLKINDQDVDITDSIGKWEKREAGYELVNIAQNAGMRRFVKTKETIPIEPFKYTGEKDGQAVYEAPFYCLYDGLIEFKVYARDVFGRSNEKITNVTLSAPENTYYEVDGEKIFDYLEPHAVWRANVTKNDHGENTVSIPNYVWRVNWNPNSIMLLPKVITETADSIGRQIINGNVIEIKPYLQDEEGRSLSGKIRRYYSGNTSVYGLEPTYEITTEKGTFIFWVKIFNGDPIIRIGGKFVSKTNERIQVAYNINGATNNAAIISPTNSFNVNNQYSLWRMKDKNRGPVFITAYNKKPESDSSLNSINFRNIQAEDGKTIELPMIAMGLVDADIEYSKVTNSSAVATLGKTMAKASLAVPDINVEMNDIGVKNNIFDLEYVRKYTFLENDYNLKDSGQFFAVPWCAENTLSKTKYPSYGAFHSAFGNRPYVVTKDTNILMNMPMPDISSDTLAPNYATLAGDWYKNAKEDMEFFMSLQLEDGTYDRYYRMDHYSLGRITFAMMLAYPAFSDDKAFQNKIAGQVRLSLSRMLGEVDYKILSDSSVQKNYGEEYQVQNFEKGNVYKPFTYHPQWDFNTEMYGFVDMNLGHVHLFYTMLLYGKYIDSDYLKRADVQERIKQLIKFEWMNQDLNGDIYRVVIGGVNAAGSGDGYEEDLVLILPELAKLAGLHTDWYNLACRVATMKFGALKYFDYIPVDNEWKFNFLTPIHNVDFWCPESGWNETYYGDVWWMGPATAGSVYGKWYFNNVFKQRPDVVKQMMYDLFEEHTDPIGRDQRHWLGTNMYVTEAYLTDPFLGAVKLMNAYQRGKKGTGFVDKNTQGENIWNFPFYACEMTLINDELIKKYDFMKNATPIDNGAQVTGYGFGYDLYSYTWKIDDGAVVSAASYSRKENGMLTVTLDAEQFGLSTNGNWEVTDLYTNKKQIVPAKSKIDINTKPRTPSTFVIKNAK